MKTYICDKCGAEFHVDDDSYDDVCPECDSDRTTLLFDEGSFNNKESRDNGSSDYNDDDDFDDDLDDEDDFC